VYQTKEGNPLALTIATAQLLVGCVYAVFLWVAPDARKPPKITFSDFLKLIPVGVCSAAAHAASVVGLAYGVVFGQIVKAAEPAFAAVIGTVIYGKKFSTAKWLCLIPIIGGVALSALTKVNGEWKLDFSMSALLYCGASNVFAAFKGAENDKLMAKGAKADDPKGKAALELKERIGPGNQFALMTIISFLVSVPVAYGKEGAQFWKFVGDAQLNTKNLGWNLIMSGLTFYGYNEVAVKSLNKMDAVTNSVANTAKRVIVIVFGAIVFKEPFLEHPNKVAGCFISIAAVFLYSVIDDLLKPKEKKH